MVVAFEAAVVPPHFFALPPLVLSVGHVHRHVARTYYPWTWRCKLAKTALALPVPEIVTETEVEYGENDVGPVQVVIDFKYLDILFAIRLAFAPRTVGEALENVKIPKLVTNKMKIFAGVYFYFYNTIIAHTIKL